MTVNKYQVLIIGCGPTAVVLANILGKAGIKVAIIEKEKDVYPVPRATHIDEETLRNFQATGLMNNLIRHTTTFGYVEIVDEKGNILLEENTRDPNSRSGYEGSCFFDQPAFERVLRTELENFPDVNLFSGTEAVEAEYYSDFIKILVRDIFTGDKFQLDAEWIIGCDGGKSFVREQGGITMDSFAPKKYWLIVDSILKNPKDACLLPDRFRYLLNPERLTLYAYGFGNNRRWEFQMEDGEKIPDKKTIYSWLEKFIETDKLEITRIMPYSHNSLIARSWRKGRMFIAGDAAHMMPPSAGQGLCSGVRDAINLGWKLIEVINNGAAPCILDTYQEERKPHVEEILKGALFISEGINPGNELKKRFRNLLLKIIGNLPPLQSLLRNASIRKRPFESGFLGKTGKLTGHQLPQFKITKYDENLWSDNLLDFRFNLINVSGTFSGETLSLLDNLGIKLINQEPDFRYFQNDFQNWLKENKTDYAIVRPDRVIYSTGKTEDLKSDLLSLTEKLNKKSYSIQ
jgi:3-(3-hydroxy-phenyl)propionate hydroxylase